MTVAQDEGADDFMRFMQLVWPGPLTVQAICTAARLGIADILADGPKTVGELAASASTVARTLRRLLYALTTVGLFHSDGDDSWRNSPLSELLRKDHPRSMRPWALIMGAPLFWKPMAELHRSIVTGKAGFNHVFQAHFFDHLKASSDDATLFNQAMAAQSAGFVNELAKVYDFSQFSSVIDIGGGTGNILAGILTANPKLKGVLFELPDVIEQVEDPLVQQLDGRLRLDSGDFFAGIPAGPDCYMMVRVIHDWPDEEAATILQNCRRAMGSRGTLILVENILDEKSPPMQAMMDMLMLVLVGSMERTEQEFRTLLREGGFVVSDIIKKERISLLECRPA